MSGQNHVLSRRWFTEAWNDRSDATVAELICPDCVGHMESGEFTGAEPFQRVRDGFFAAFPDLRMVVEDVVADGDDVVVRWNAVGTHTGDGLGMEPTHLPVNVHGMTWHRYRDGKMVEAWDSWNQEALMQRLREGPDEHRERTRTLRQDLAARIRTVRVEQFGEQGGPEMARLLGISARALFQYETGVTIPAEVLLQIIEQTGARPAWLLRGEEPRYQVPRPTP